MQRRRSLAEEFRKDVFLSLATSAGGYHSGSPQDTRDALKRGIDLILPGRPIDDATGERRAAVHALVRLGRHDERYVYAPLLVKNSEVVESSKTRRLLVTSLGQISPSFATELEGVGLRPTLSVTRSGVSLSHATRVLQSLGHGDPLGRGALVDRRRQVWWLELAGNAHSRFNLATYDAIFEERRELLVQHDRWIKDGGEFPTTSYWHRECEDCVYREHCHDELENRDDVSLTHYSNFEQQRLLHQFGVDTRVDLARLDPRRARLARRSPTGSSSTEAVLGLAIGRLDDLIYRARVQVSGALLRIVERELVGCPRADVEVDVDMESDGERTYLWGAHVRLAPDVGELHEGYHSFVSWGDLTGEEEARVFADFWGWFNGLRRICASRGLTFAAYCFWAQAEDSAMNRAVDRPFEGGPTRQQIDEFRAQQPPQWIDLHALAKAQIQTTGPLGLKVLARAAGFQWRDENPSGEASMHWYEAAIGEDDAEGWRRRILEYNEDDCRATLALRDWLNGPARELAHRDRPDES